MARVSHSVSWNRAWRPAVCPGRPVCGFHVLRMFHDSSASPLHSKVQSMCLYWTINPDSHVVHGFCRYRSIPDLYQERRHFFNTLSGLTAVVVVLRWLVRVLVRRCDCLLSLGCGAILEWFCDCDRVATLKICPEHWRK